jgi:uncharacterized protein (TIGR02217 family)
MSFAGFHNVLFPLQLARGAVGGPQRRTDIVALANGREVRVAALSGARRRWEVSSAMIGLDGLADITAFFEARRGRLFAFRFRDPVDASSSPIGGAPAAGDQLLGTGDGVTRTFQLIRAYGDAGGSSSRMIQLPQTGSVVVAVTGVVKPASSFVLEPLGGTITFNSAPPAGAVVSAGFRFDCAARFDTDSLDIALDAFNAGRTLSIPLVEVML